MDVVTSEASSVDEYNNDDTNAEHEYIFLFFSTSWSEATMM